MYMYIYLYIYIYMYVFNSVHNSEGSSKEEGDATLIGSADPIQGFRRVLLRNQRRRAQLRVRWSAGALADVPRAPTSVVQFPPTRRGRAYT